jgi:hypothetical protein
MYVLQIKTDRLEKRQTTDFISYLLHSVNDIALGYSFICIDIYRWWIAKKKGKEYHWEKKARSLFLYTLTVTICICTSYDVN